MAEQHVRYDDGVVGQVDGMKVPRYAGLTHVRAAARGSRTSRTTTSRWSGCRSTAGSPTGPAPGSVRRTSGRPHACCARTTPRWTPSRSATPRWSTPATSPPTRSTSTRRSDQTREGLRALMTDAGRPVLSLGGDHTIALPALQAVHSLHGPVALVHFDAHLDTWDTYFDAPLHARHAVPARGRAGPDRQGPLGPRRHPRARSTTARTCSTTPSSGSPWCTAATSSGSASTAWSTASCERVGDQPVYVSIDIDVLDPAFAPGTGTPEAGGHDQPRAARGAPRR